MVRLARLNASVDGIRVGSGRVAFGLERVTVALAEAAERTP